MKKVLFYTISILILAAIITPVIITSIERNQFDKNSGLLSKSEASKQSDVAVIYFSRSGNTAIMANKIAKMFDAELITIEAPKYEIGLQGLANAAMSFQDHEVEITPQTIDLAKYSKIYLGSPIWFYRPSPPIWKFAENNRFDGKDVVFFNSYNSNYGQDYIDEFKSLVMRNGAKSFEHKAIVDVWAASYRPKSF
jgi:flavodoxin